VSAEPVIAPSARKHGVSDEDIRHAYANPVRVFELDDGFVMLIGANAAAVLHETGVVEATTGPVVVHAMRAREKVPEVTTMPRTVKDILEHADELAKRFEDYEPSPDDEREPEVFAALRRSVLARSEAERSISQAVTEARSHGYSWRTIGALLGTTGEAARQRYGVTQKA
jgi:hypothetical protein